MEYCLQIHFPESKWLLMQNCILYHHHDPHLPLLSKEVSHIRNVVTMLGLIVPVVPVFPQVEGEGVPEGPGVPGEQGHELPGGGELGPDSQ